MLIYHYYYARLVVFVWLKRKPWNKYYSISQIKSVSVLLSMLARNILRYSSVSRNSGKTLWAREIWISHRLNPYMYGQIWTRTFSATWIWIVLTAISVLFLMIMDMYQFFQGSYLSTNHSYQQGLWLGQPIISDAPQACRRRARRSQEIL